MGKLQKIGELANKYDVTSRTLRYYEEMGLLNSTRVGESQYRYYDEKAINRLQQLILLRKLQLPIRDIQEILNSKDMEVIINAFNNKLKLLEDDINGMRIIKNTIEELLYLLKVRGYSEGNGLTLLMEESRTVESKLKEKEEAKKALEMEEFEMAAESINKLTDVRIIKLRPMKVAWYRHESASPEDDAWDVMNKWAKEQGIEELFSSRYFGFNNPCPGPGNPVYGYEVWITVNDDVKSSGDIKIKTFEGGLYVVTNTTGFDCPKAWKKLDKWVKESEYVGGKHQWLEEHIVVDENSWGEKMQLDLYYPISEK